MKPSTVSLLALSAFAACQEPLPPNNSQGDATSPGDAPSDAAVSMTSYQPMGCEHRVYIPQGAADFVRDDRATFGAMPTPLNVHVTWPASPASTIAFLWKTDAGTRASVVQYGTDPNQLTLSAVGHVMSVRSLLGMLTQHEVHVCGLRPDTTYYYRVGGEGHWSEVQSFKTAPAPGRDDYDVNFAVSGDSRDSFAVWRMVQDRVLSVSGMRTPDFQVFSGDAVAAGMLQAAWDEWFSGAASTMRRMPFVTAHGNHDALSLNYLMQFAQPQVGRPEQDELYFSFDYGPIHFVFLNDTPYQADYTGNFQGTQVNWLRADLTAHRARRAQVPWIIAVHHKPAFSSSRWSTASDTAIVRRTLPPVYDEFGVDLVLNGHDHDFEVTRPLDGQGREVTGRRGVIYITAAGAGAELYEAGSQPWRRYSESVINFLLVHVTNRVLEVTPYRGDGTVITEGRVSLTPR